MVTGAVPQGIIIAPRILYDRENSVKIQIIISLLEETYFFSDE